MPTIFSRIVAGEIPCSGPQTAKSPLPRLPACFRPGSGGVPRTESQFSAKSLDNLREDLYNAYVNAIEYGP